MPDRMIAFERALAGFPAEAAALLRAVPSRGGAIPAAEAGQLGEWLGMERHALMVALLPLATAFAHTPISGFAVGAVAAGHIGPDRLAALYLGANFEFAGESTALSVHAEQAAAANAWLAGETGLSAMAASSIPCGHCRQFLYELEGARSLDVLLLRGGSARPRSTTLAELLPDAFGPQDLGIATGFMASRGDGPRLALDGPHDAVHLAALQAARASYAPYTGAFAGCALQCADGAILVGRTIENAAHNPGLAAVQVMFSRFNTSPLRGQFEAIRRIVLVERATTNTQAALTERCARALAPQSAFDYCRADLSPTD